MIHFVLRIEAISIFCGYTQVAAASVTRLQHQLQQESGPSGIFYFLLICGDIIIIDAIAGAGRGQLSASDKKGDECGPTIAQPKS